jgi:glycosyltransferase involved in cell wall biosynthesis
VEDRGSNSFSPEPVTVVVPALNEERSVGPTIQRLQETLSQAQIPHEILIVDDGSTDRTGEVALKHGARVIDHRQNLGYGRSLKDGILAAEHDLIAMTDADGTYPIERLPELIQLARDHHMVVARRTGRIYHGGIAKRLARFCFRTLGEFATGRRIPDINSGMRVFRRSQIAPFFPAIGSGFSFTTSSTLLYLLNDLFVYYLPTEYHPREGRSKVRPFRDTLRALQIVIEVILRYNPIKIFLLLAAPFAIAALALALASFAFGMVGQAALLAFAAFFMGVSGIVLALGFATAALVRPRPLLHAEVSTAQRSHSTHL